MLTLSTLYPDQGRPGFGGFVERQAAGLAARDDIEVEVVAGIGLPPWPLSLHPHYRLPRKLPLEEIRAGLRIHRPRFRVLPGIPARSARALSAAALPLVKGLHARAPFDVIDAEFFWPDGVAAMQLSRALGIPFSVKARGSDIHFWGERPAIRAQIIEAASEAGGLLAVSEAMKASMIALGMNGEGIRVHHTGLDLDRFVPIDRAAARARLGIEGPLIVSAGALIPIKGHRLAIEALAGLPGVTLILAGDGPERKALEQQARRLGLSERVRFLGARPHAELPGLLAAADALVLASEREGLANVWVEALACGTPLVISDAGGAREVIDRPAAGRIVARSPSAIADAVREILAAPPTQAAVRASAERFSWARNASELADHLSAVSAQRH